MSSTDQPSSSSVVACQLPGMPAAPAKHLAWDSRQGPGQACQPLGKNRVRSINVKVIFNRLVRGQWTFTDKKDAGPGVARCLFCRRARAARSQAQYYSLLCVTRVSLTNEAPEALFFYSTSNACASRCGQVPKPRPCGSANRADVEPLGSPHTANHRDPANPRHMGFTPQSDFLRAVEGGLMHLAPCMRGKYLS